jgi:biotin transport system substrate-specific component
MSAEATSVTSVPSAPARSYGIRVAAALAGAIAVAAAAQVAIPVPGTPIPMTLQPLAVLIVGGLLGPRFGALSLVIYLAMGAAGLPAYTPGGLPGAARLFGPSGGFLLAYPFAASLTGYLAARATRSWHYFVASFAGLVAIFAGGLSQLTIVTGSWDAAIRLGGLPFLAKDLASIIVAGLLISRFQPKTRALS